MQQSLIWLGVILAVIAILILIVKLPSWFWGIVIAVGIILILIGLFYTPKPKYIAVAQ